METMNGMNDIMFTTKDVIYLFGIAIGIVMGWLKLKHDAETQSNKILNLEFARKEAEKKYSEEILYAKNSRKAIRKHLEDLIRDEDDKMKDLIEKKDEISHKRIDKTQEDMKRFVEKTDAEFKAMNQNISDIKQTTSEMKGMLQTLLAKK